MISVHKKLCAGEQNSTAPFWNPVFNQVSFSIISNLNHQNQTAISLAVSGVMREVMGHMMDNRVFIRYRADTYND